MGIRDLREYIEAVRMLGELRTVSGANCEQEIAAITEVAAASPACPMLLFDNIKGCKSGYRVVTNLLHTEKRLAVATGYPPEIQALDLLKKWKGILGKLTEGPPPVEVTDGPVLENVVDGEGINLFEFPAVKWHALDGGPYFTGGVTIMREPDEGWVNLGVYRLQIQGRSTLSLAMEPGKHGDLISRKYWERGKSCPVAVSLGHAPALFIAGVASAPLGVSEYRIAGYLSDMPVEVLLGRLTGLPVPAASEAVLEGEVPPLEVESHVEGPVGEASGYYASEPALKPVIRVKSVMHRNNPIIQGAPQMVPLPGLAHFAVHFRGATLWNELDKCGIPDIAGVWRHGMGFIVVSLKQKYAGHAKQAALIARGSRSSQNVRFIVTVDDDIDASNVNEVLWAMATRCDPERDIEVVSDGWSEAIDPIVTAEQRARRDLTTAKVIVNACKPIFRRSDFPAVNRLAPAVKEEIMKKWWEIIK